jgi:diguanylate cyclase (GGDEF)-like protein
MKDPNDTRNIAPRRGSPLWIDMTTVTVAGTVVLVLAVLKLRGPRYFFPAHQLTSPHHIAAAQSIVATPLFWTLALMIVAGEVWRIMTPGKSGPESPAASITISFAVMLYWGFPVAVLLRAIAIIMVGLAQRKSWHRTVFNAAQLSISLAAAGLALAAAGISPTPRHHWVPTGADLPFVLLAALAYFVVNFCLVATAVSLYSRTSVRTVVRANLRYQGFSHLVLFAAAPLVTVALATGSARIVALIAFPLTAIYVNAASSVQREHQASHDELTGLCNRKLLTRLSAEALAKAAASGSRAGFLLLDLDRSSGLKEVNDTLGHAVGDRLLQIVAQRLTRSVRPGDVVARLGGDEFAVLLPSVREVTAAREVAARLRAALSEPVRLEAMTFDMQASVGIAIYPDDAIGFDQLVQRADVAMYLAKERRSGIERYVAAADRNSADRLALVGDLRRALHRGEIELHFQPKVMLASERVIGVEALARWRHPQRGMLTAADFVCLAEQSYLMSELTDQVLGKALDQAAKWWLDGLRVEVSVNIPARDLLSTRLTDLIGRALQRRGLPPGALRLDIDEQVLAGRSEQAASTVRALADLGVGISLDDFGTGYSSLAMLTRLGVSEIKLDPTLIAELPVCREKNVTVKSLVNLARTLGIRSIGEGVETDAVAAALRAVGCEGAQGWFFCRPLNAEQATVWLAEHLRAGQAELAGAGLGLTAVGPASQVDTDQMDSDRMDSAHMDPDQMDTGQVAAAAPELLVSGVLRGGGNGQRGEPASFAEGAGAEPGNELARATPGG